MRKIASYTLIEIIFIVLIFGILLSMGISRFSDTTENRYYGEVCVNTLYGSISNYVYMASISKTFSGTIIPQYYHISKTDRGSGEVLLRYTLEDSSTGRYKIFNFLDEFNKCKRGTKYSIAIATGDVDINMSPGMEVEGGAMQIILEHNTNDPQITGDLFMKFCTPAGVARELCGDFARISFDRRTGLVTKKFCLEFTGANGLECMKRSTGE